MDILQGVASGLIVAVMGTSIAIVYKVYYIERKAKELTVKVDTLLERHPAKIHKDVEDIKEVLKYPDTFGIGTKTTNKLLTEVVKGLTELVTEIRVERKFREEQK